jgi:hypothetical protein
MQDKTLKDRCGDIEDLLCLPIIPIPSERFSEERLILDLSPLTSPFFIGHRLLTVHDSSFSTVP